MELAATADQVVLKYVDNLRGILLVSYREVFDVPTHSEKLAEQLGVSPTFVGLPEFSECNRCNSNDLLQNVLDDPDRLSHPLEIFMAFLGSLQQLYKCICYADLALRCTSQKQEHARDALDWADEHVLEAVLLAARIRLADLNRS